MKIAVVGAGIVGLAVARELAMRRPDSEINVIEGETTIAAHQTGHNSGVIHAGIYYPSDSLKAELCRRGGVLLREFCTDHGISYEEVGKLIVALDESELDRLAEIERRAIANGVSDVVRLSSAEMRAVEPHVAGIAALHSPSTATVDYGEVSRALATDLERRGVGVRLGCALEGMHRDRGAVILETTQGELLADEVIACAGLQSARVAAMVGDDEDPRIIPFRGEYYRLTHAAAGLVNGMIYPVPDPRYPFLGVHLTRRINGAVDVGPNAVLALALHGYRRRDVSMADLRETLTWPGFRKMAVEHWRAGAKEILGSFSKHYFTKQARRYVPALSPKDLVPAAAGVRAQAVRRDGELVDDFWITRRDGLTLVRNAPSPAATSSLAIAQHVVDGVLGP